MSGPPPPAERAQGLGALAAKGRAIALREARVFARTFLLVWVALSAAFVVFALIVSARPSGVLDFTLGIAYAWVLGFVNTFWLAVIGAVGRLAYRAVGWAAFVPLPLVVLGVVASCYLLSGWLGGLFFGWLRALAPMGPCGAHAGPLALICLVLATVGSGAALWALFKLVLGLAFTLLIGALPGVTLWLVLVARAMVRRVQRARTAPAATG